MDTNDNVKFEVVDEDNNLYGSSQKMSQNSNMEHKNTNAGDFEKQIISFFQKNKIKLYILSPCFASLCYVNYVTCLMHTVELFRKFNIQLKVEFCKNDSLEG